MNTAVEALPATKAKRTSLVAKVAAKYGVDPDKMLATLKATAFHTDKEITNEQMMSLLVVADQYDLNPWTKEIYAFPDSKRGGIVPVIGVDGWARIINENPNFDGMTFTAGPSDGTKYKSAPMWIECTMYRKDRPQHPCTVRESMVECYRDTGPWQSHPARMLRHKTMIQCARLAFGFVGVYDPDEAERIIEGTATVMPADSPIADINAEITGKTTAAEAAASPQEAPLVFTYAQVRAALDESLEGPDEAFLLAREMIANVDTTAFIPELEKYADKIAHQRADRKAAASE